MHDDDRERFGDRWARLRFAIVGPLLASPPRRGELGEEIERLAEKSWRHPRTGEPVRFGRSTIERWLYAARSSRDPLAALGRAVRRDAGEQPSLSTELRQLVRQQYEEHPAWTVRLHYDNLLVRVAAVSAGAAVPSYQSVRRFMKAQGLHRQRRFRRRDGTDSEHHHQRRRPTGEFEVRSYEVTHTHALWHADFHHGSHKVLTADGSWKTPLLVCFIDDHSRLVCHLQWYLEENAECFVHGLIQAILKRGLPRALLTDNGSAMLAGETRAGLERLAVVHQRTLAYAAYQNAKQEVFWAQVEGRLVAMLEGVEDLRLALLNEATQAWVETEYHRRHHSELGTTPLERYLSAPTLGRPSPSPTELRRAFRAEAVRTQRRSDGTISLFGRRFEIPTRYRHLQRLHLHYASWDLSAVDLIDPRTAEILTAVYPLDKQQNASGRRRRIAPPPTAAETSSPSPPRSGVAPLLAELLRQYAATGLPPAYLPKKNSKNSEEENQS